MPHIKLNVWATALLGLLVAGCGGESTPTSATPNEPAKPVLTAATLGEQNIVSNAEYLTLEAYKMADTSNGEAQAQICKACHSLQEGGPNMIGPALHGFFGREAGSQPEFRYSSALQQADFSWTPRALDAWLLAPSRFLPGNTMVFPGVVNASDRNDLIAYLLNVTSVPSDE